MTMQPKILLLHNHDNSWTPRDLIETEQDRQGAMKALRKFGYEVTDVKVYHSVAQALERHHFDPREWLVFNWCEGYADRPWDYDGVTEELDRLGFVYTGADTWSLRTSADKGRVQAALREAGVPMPRGRVLQPGDERDWSIFPAIVKPVNQHGSYGIDRQAIVSNEQQLRERVQYVADQFHAPALVEEFIAGREFQVTMWGNDRLEVLPEVEVAFMNATDWREQIYTYEIKFDCDAPAHHPIRFLCPAMLTPQMRQAIARVCRRTYRALRCRDYARIDLRMRNKRVYVLDVNANPDINSESLLVIAANVEGLTYEEVVARITELGVERWQATYHAAGVKRSRKREQPAVVSKRI